MGTWLKVVVALVPIVVGGLRHHCPLGAMLRDMALLTREYADIKGELDHQRELLEQRLGKCP